MFVLLLRMALRQLGDRPWRSIITLTGVALGVALVVSIRTANLGVLQAFEQSVLAVAGAATLQVQGGEQGLDEAVIVQVRAHPAVRSATPVLHQQVRLTTGPHAGLPLVILGLDLLEAPEAKSFSLEGGGDQGALERLVALDTLFVGARLAAEWGLRVGDPLEVGVGTQRYRVTVRGIVHPTGPSSAWDALAVMDIAAMQGLFGLEGRLDRIDLQTTPGVLVSQVADELRAMLSTTATVERPARRTEQVDRMVHAFQLNLSTLSAVGLLVGALLVYNTVAFVVARRRREIGILRAYGLSRGGVLALFVLQAAGLGLLGGILGGVVGVLWAQRLVGLLARTVSDLYVTISVDRLEVGLSPVLLLCAGLLGLAVAVVGAGAPAFEASQTAPARAVSPGDYEASRELAVPRLLWLGTGSLLLATVLTVPGPIGGIPLFGYGAALALLLGLSFLAPLLVRQLGWLTTWHKSEGRPDPSLRRIALAQLARAPGRNGVTVSALMIGIAIMLGVGLMIHSFRYTVELWVDQTILADLIIAPPSWLQGDEHGMLARRVPIGWKTAVEELPGVAAVDPYREARVELDGRSVALVSRDLRLHAERSRYLFLSGQSQEVLARTVAEDAVVVSETLARLLHLSTDEPLLLPTPDGPREFTIMGQFYDYATDGGKIVMDRSLYRRLWNDDDATVLAVYLSPDGDVESVRRQILARVGRDGGFIVISNAELRREIMTIFDRTFAITYALELTAVVIGLLGIVNTLLISTVERRRELSTLRAIGASGGQIRRLVMWESAYLGLLGAGLGLAGGPLLAVLLLEVINKQSFGWSVQFALSGWLLLQAIVLSLGVSLLAAYWPAWWASRLPIAEGLRYE